MAKKSTYSSEPRQRRILYIITKSVWGGAAKYVYDLATCLVNEFEVTVAAGGQGKFAQRIKETNISYYQINNFQRKINPLKDFFAFFETLSLIYQLKPDVIHVSSSKAGGLVSITAWLYKFFTGRRPRLIFTAHGWAFNEDRPNWQIDLIKLFSKLTALFYDKIICVSEHDRKTALKNSIAPADKLITIHNGIDAESISFLPREEAQKKLLGKASPFVVGTIAEWTKNKGLLYLLEAAKTIPADFILIGSGENPDKEKLERYIKRHNLKNIYLREWINNAASYLKAFDIFVLPSIKEGLPYTILETMTAEVPIIATKVGGIPEMIKNNTGILIQSKNSQQLAELINYLKDNPKIVRTITQKAKKRILKKFGLEKMLKETKRAYFSKTS